ncbi:MAG: hypothetical protein HY701_05350, partial [Gemmatimonadetes bacterium]|nr:hypothetical protein [Gemmatimonadota bacterium]
VGQLRDWAELARLAGNDFETVILPRYPHLDRLKRDIQETDPQLALLTGSGSALFAIYRSEQELEAAHETLGRRFPGIMFIPTRTLTEMPRVQPA